LDDDTVAMALIDRPVSRTSISRAVRQVLDSLDGTSDLEGSSKAMIKPNLCCGKDWTTGATTNPEVVREVALWLLENGVEELILADGTIVGQDTMENMSSTGLLDLASELGMEVLDLNADERVEISVKDPLELDRIKLARTAIEVDLLVNIPVMKTHICTSVTLSVKNMKGLLDDTWKKRFHFRGLDRCLADLATCVSPGLNIIDGSMGMEGRGPINGEPRGAGIIIASRDMLAADVAASRIMDFDPVGIRHLQFWAERREIDLTSYSPHTIGQVEAIPFRKAPSVLDQRFQGVELEWGEPCSGCACALGAALSHMERDGDLASLEEKGGAVIALGPEVDPEGSGNLVLMGKCQHRNRSRGHYIPGCPPQSPVIRGTLYEMMGRESDHRKKFLDIECEGTSDSGTTGARNGRNKE